MAEISHSQLVAHGYNHYHTCPDGRRSYKFGGGRMIANFVNLTRDIGGRGYLMNDFIDYLTLDEKIIHQHSGNQNSISIAKVFANDDGTRLGEVLAAYAAVQ